MLETFFFHRHLADNEHITLVVHKHWLIGIKELVMPSIFVLFAALLLVTQPQGIAFWIVVAFETGCCIWWLRQFFNYYLDVWIITDQGIIDLNWVGWFHRQSARVLYSDIQGVSYEIQGVFATILHYGELSVEKISTGATVSLPYVYKPKSVEAVILKNMEEYLHGKNMKNSKHVQEILSEFVSERMQLKDVETKVPHKPQ